MGRSELPSAKQSLLRRGTTACLGRGIRKAQRKVCAVPQGESVLDASMMADLIVSKKGDRVPAQTSPPQLRAPGRKAPAWWSTVAVGGKTWKRALPGWFLVLGRSLCGYSLPRSERLLKGRSGHTRQSGHWRIKAIRMIGRDRKGCQRSGRAGLDRALVAAEGGSRLPSCDAAPRGGCRPDGRGVAGYPRRVGKRETTALSLARRGERLLCRTSVIITVRYEVLAEALSFSFERWPVGGDQYRPAGSV